jgi:uncharacterized protein YacL
MIETLIQFKYIIIALILIFLDKLITAMTILRVEKNYPNKDKFSVEKNPVALYFFRNYGLLAGTILYFILSYFMFNFSVWLLSFVIGTFYSFLVIASIYVLVIINNIRWFVRFGNKSQEVKINIAK